MTDFDMETLVGHTITKAIGFDESPNQEWAHHDTFWLWLDDGRVIEFSSYGYDADGATVDEIEVVDVVDCLRCHKAHGPTKVTTYDFGDEWMARKGIKAGDKYAFCSNGNDVAIVLS